MRPPRNPQHRYSRLQLRASDRAYHVSRVIHAVVVFEQLLSGMRWMGAGNYEIHPGLVSKARAACADAIPYAKADDEGYRL
jgi:hypothetical protein